MKLQRDPNLFIIGAMKSGTTSLHSYLNEHPQIFMCEPKEPGFFVEELAWSKGLDWYRGLFEGATDEKIVGESSTHYTKLPIYGGVPERIRQFNPEARFVYVMRDPVDRLISHYWHNVRDLQWVAEKRGMLKAVTQDPQYLGFSDYAMQLKPYIQLFGRDALHVITFESLIADPRKVIRDLFSWLGVDREFVPEGLGEAWNALPANAKRVKGWGLLNRLRYSNLWSKLAPHVPPSLRNMASSLAEAKLDKSAEDLRKVINYVRPLLLERTQELRSVLGKDFPEWRTLGNVD